MNKKNQSARGLALQILGQIFDKGAYSNIALKQELDKSELSQRDKALVTEIVYGTIARKITLEWYLAHVIKDRDKVDSWIYHLLMMSLYQLLYLDKIPAHAVVNEAVNLAKRGRGTDKFVNAILRKFVDYPLPEVDTIKRINKRLSVQYSTPVWLVKTLVDEYGQERSERILESLFVRNKASVRVVNPDHVDELAEVLQAEKSQLSPVGLVKDHGHFAGTEAFKVGEITIQDETSQLVAPTLKLEGHERVLDACAAPGGKAMHMASYLTSGQVLALDVHDHKLDLIKENAIRLHLEDKIATEIMDARKVHEHFAADSFDKILVDAPCSGIGLIRRKPDIKYTKETGDFESLQKTQLEILDSVCQTVKKGGIITYSTCTIVSKENQEVLAQFLEQHPNFEQVPLEHDCQDIVKDGCILITPELYGTDGFFICQVKRIA